MTPEHQFLSELNKKLWPAAAFRDGTGAVLFIDARKLGYMVDRVLRAFTDEDTEKIVSTFHAWKRTRKFQGECKRR